MQYLIFRLKKRGGYMQLPDADHWVNAPDGPDKDGEVSDSLWGLIIQLCQQVERLEDELTQLRKR